jgi:hypothetical protein
MSKCIGIIGTRRRDTEVDYELVLSEFQNIYENGDRIVSGGCPKGGDNFAECIAKNYQIPIMIHYAQWNKYGPPAGFIRNADIAKDADVLIACVHPDRCGGTEDTIRKFEKLDKGEVILV